MSNIIINPQSGILEFNTGAASGSAFDNSLSGAARLKFESSGVLGLTSLGTGVTDKFTIDGSNGRLFTVNNTVTGSIFSVNDVAGLPIVEVFSDDRVVMGKYASDALVVSGSGVSFANVPTVSGNPIMTGVSSEDVDTLATVTARGATTTSSITTNGLTSNANITTSSNGIGIFTRTLAARDSNGLAIRESTSSSGISINSAGNTTIDGNITVASSKHIGIGATLASIQFGDGSIGNETADLSFVTNSDGEITFHRGENKLIMGTDHNFVNGEIFVNDGLRIGTTTHKGIGGNELFTISGGGGAIPSQTWTNAHSSALYLRNYNNANGEWQLQPYNGGNGGVIQLAPYGGNVTIGNLTASAKLDIRSDNGNSIRCESSTGAYFVVAHGGKVGIKDATPIGDLQIGTNVFGGANGVHADNRIGLSVNGSLKSMVYASTYNNATYPDYGMVFIHGPDTSSYNVWSISPDGPAKGDSLNFIYGSNTSNIHTATPKVVFDGNGNVGIGVTDPDEQLEVDGNIKISAGKFLRMAGNGYQIGTDGTPSRIQFHAGGSERMFITGNGNVSIGTDIAPQKLNVKGTIVHLNASDIQVAGITNSNNAGRLYANNAGGVSKVLLDSNGVSYFNGGNVGIGVTDPDEQLEVQGKTHLGSRGQDGGASIEYASFSETNGGASTILGNAVYAGTANNTYRKTRSDFGNFIALNYNKGITFHTYVTGSASSTEYDINQHEQMRITTGGSVGIGVADPDATLEVKGAGNTNATTSFVVRDSDDAVLLKARNDGVVTVEHGYFYVSASAGAYVQNNFRVRGSLFNDQGTLQIGNSSGTAFDGDVNFDANTLFVDSSTNRIGIGTTTPDALLHVYSAGNGEIEVERNGGAKINLQAQASKGVIGTDSNHQLDLKTNGGARMSLLTNGDVGIGTTAPLDMLHIYGSVRADLKLEGAFQGGATDVGKLQFAYGPRSGDVNHRNIASISAYNTTTDSGAGAYLSITTRATSGSMSERIRVNQDGQVDIYGNASFASYLYHKGDEDTNIKFNTDDVMINVGGATFFRATETTQNTIKLNSDNEDTDFYLYSTSSTPAIFMRGSDGEVGIGTNNPTSTLHVKGNAAIVGASSDGVLTVTNAAASQSLRIDQNSIRTTTDNNLTLFSNGTSSQLVLQNGGNVGIGTNNPQRELEIHGAGNVYARITASTDNDSAALELNNNGNAIWTLKADDTDSDSFKITHDSAGTALTIDTSKNVGIGTNSPSTVLDVSGAYARINGAAAGFAEVLRLQRNGGNYYSVGLDNSRVNFVYNSQTTANSSLTIDGGNTRIGIGTHAPDTRLHVYGGDNTGLFGSIRNDFTNRMNMKVAMSSTTRYIGTVQQYGNGDSSGFTIKVYDGAEKVFRIVRVVVQNSGGTNVVRATVEGGGEDTDIHINLGHKNRDGDATKTDFFLVPTSKSFSQYVEIEGYILRDTGWNTTSLTSVSLDDDLALNILDSVNGSRVGVGTTDPSAKLHAEGSMIVKGDATWAGTDNNNGAIYMNTNARGLLGAFSTSYARNLIRSNNNYIELGNQSTSLINGFQFYAGSTTATVGTYDFFTSGTNSRLHIEKGGNIGLNTTTPKGKLHIEGNKSYSLGYLDATSDLHIGNDTMSSAVGAYAGSITFGSTDESNLQAASIVAIQTDTDPNEIGLAFFTQHSQFGSTDLAESMRIRNDGNVGIGTTNPASILDVNGGSANGAKIQAANAATEYVLNAATSNGTSRLWVGGAGNVGIGTVDPATRLDVVGTYRIADNTTNANNKLHRMLGRHYTNAEQEVNIFSSISTSTTNALSFGGGSSSYNTATNIYFYTASNNTSTYAVGQERMRITNAGNIGIGVTSDPSSKLHVNGELTASTKTFDIEHPTQSGKRLVHGCFEGPEYGVYFRGKTQDSGIQAPEYWSGLVDIDSMTVDVTPIGPNQSIYVDRVEDNGDVYVGANTEEPLNYFYIVYGERKDIDNLVIVKDAPVASPNEHID